MVVDPWFNFRATKYLVQNGFYSFWDWFDDSKHLLTKENWNTQEEERLEHSRLLDGISEG